MHVCTDMHAGKNTYTHKIKIRKRVKRRQRVWLSGRTPLCYHVLSWSPGFNPQHWGKKKKDGRYRGKKGRVEEREKGRGVWSKLGSQKQADLSESESLLYMSSRPTTDKWRGGRWA